MKYFLVLILIFTTGCAQFAQIRPESPPPADSKIGFLYLGPKYPKHVHVGTTVFQNSEKIPESGTDYSPILKDSIRAMLSEKSYSIVEIDESSLPEKVQLEPYIRLTGSLKKEFVDFIEIVSKENNLDYIFVFKPNVGPAFVNSSVYIYGFGLYTQCRFNDCKAEVLNYFDLDIIDTTTSKPIDLWNWNYFKLNNIFF